MLEGLPFLFLDASDTDSYFSDESASGDNLNNSDPDLLPDRCASECDHGTYGESYDDYEILQGEHEELAVDFDDLQDEFDALEESGQKFMPGGEATMRYGMPLLETLHESFVQPAKPQSMREALKESRQEPLPRRSFERLVARVCSGEVKRNNVR